MNNRIFVGPPGSGKTYGAKYEVVKTIWNLMDEEERNKKNSRYYMICSLLGRQVK